MSEPAQHRAFRTPRLLRILAAAGAITLTLVVCVGLAILVLFQNNAAPTVWRNPPLYPGAQDVRVTNFGEQGVRESDGGYGEAVFIMKIITYTVTAPQADVISFYRSAFSAGSMAPSDWGRRFPGAKDLNYSWTTHVRTPSDYFLDLITRAVDSSHLEVEIGVSMFPGY